MIDHELLTAPHKYGGLKRVAAFGWYAGAVGAGEALCLTGLALLRKGVATPLLVRSNHLLLRLRLLADKQHLPRPYTFTSVEEYKAGLRKVGEAIRAAPVNSTRQPIVIGITG